MAFTEEGENMLKSKSKILAILLSMVLVIGMIPASAFAEDTVITEVKLTCNESAITFDTTKTEKATSSLIGKNAMFQSVPAGAIEYYPTSLFYWYVGQWYGIGDGSKLINSMRKYAVSYKLSLSSGYTWPEGVASGDFSKLNITINGEVYQPEDGNWSYDSKYGTLYLKYVPKSQQNKLVGAVAEVELPQEGKSSSSKAKAASADYTASVVKWYEGGTLSSPGREMKSTDVFSADQIYIAEVAFTPAEGKTFAPDASGNGLYISNMNSSLYMPSLSNEKAVVVRGYYKCPSAPRYDVSVTGGSAAAGGNPAIQIMKGTKVTLTADPAPKGQLFDKWEVVSGSVVLADAYNNVTTFVMPEGNVSVTAKYKDDPEAVVEKKSITEMETALSASTYTYSGEYKRPAVKVENPDVTLVKDKDYTVSYSDNKYVGTAKVTIKGIGNYEGEIVKTFKINPSKVTLSKVTKTASGKFKATWKKHSTQTTGFQVRYSTSSSFKTYKTVTVSGKSAVSKTVSKLKKGKKYYVKVRAYKTVNGTKYYGSWSARKYVRV